jgi:penicillin-binding protein 2
VKRILSPTNVLIKEVEPSVLRDLSDVTGEYKIKNNVFKAVKEGMRLVVNGERGTARGSKLHYIEMAGKTGTSQVMNFSADQIYNSCEGRPKYQRHHGWFVGYAPADNPEIAIGVLAEHSCHGASGAAPVAKAIVAAYVAKYHPEWLDRDLRKKKDGAPVHSPASSAPVVEGPIEGE